MIASEIQSALMAAKRDKAASEQVGFRINVDTMKRLRRYVENHILQPSPARIVEVAIDEWLDRNEGLNVSPPKKPR